MWQNKFASPLDLEISPSRYLLYYLVVLHGLAMAALFVPMQLPMTVRGLILLTVMVSLLWRIYRYRLQGRVSTRLGWRADDSWDYHSGSQRIEGLQLLSDSYVTGWLMILQLKKPGRCRVSVVLLPDSLPEDQWHLLRIRLRYLVTA